MSHMVVAVDKKIALVGSGKAAHSYLEWCPSESFDVFTTEGKGEFCGKDILPISDLNLDNYEQVIIASQYVDEIIEAWLEQGKSIEKLYWYDFLYKRLGHLPQMSFQSKKNQKPLYVVYDLAVLPASFDMATFLIRAELYRKKLGLDYIALVILSGNFAGLSARANLSHGADGGNWRINHILIPMSQLLPSCLDIIHISDQQQLHGLISNRPTFPIDVQTRADFNTYALAPLKQYAGEGHEVRLLEAPAQARVFVEQFLVAHHIKQPFVCISLREYEHQTSRNSCLDTYHTIASHALKQGYGVVVIRDTNMAMAAPLGWEGVVECPVASFDIAIRMALYESALLNVSVSSGPSCGLMLLSQKVSFILTHIVEDSQWLSNEAFLESRQGIKRNQQYPFSSPFQQICWTNDSLGILTQFKQMLDKLSSAAK